jgi:type IV secretion system protein VirB6
MRAAVTMFLGASVYAALMLIVLKVSGTLVSGWRIGQGGTAQAADHRTTATSEISTAVAPAIETAVAASSGPSAARPASSERVREILGATRMPANDAGEAGSADRRSALLTTATRRDVADQPVSSALTRDRRVSGLGARFRTPPPPVPGKPRT